LEGMLTSVFFSLHCLGVGSFNRMPIKPYVLWTFILRGRILHHIIVVSFIPHLRNNMAWFVKGFQGPPFSIICSFYRWRMSVALQRVQVTAILLRAVVAASEASSRLGVLPSFSPIWLHNLLRVTSDGFRS
jgi:hypothetical protein